MAKAALELAVLDAELRAAGVSLAARLGGTRDRVACGVSVGRFPVAELVEQVAGYVADGYRRVKLKILPGHDVEPVGAVRAQFPDLALWADANGSYSPDDVDALRALAEFDLGLLEQPLPEDDLLGLRRRRPRDRHAGVPRRVDHVGPRCRSGRRARRVLGDQHQGRRASAGTSKPCACTTSVARTACRCGAAGCSRPASAARPTSRVASLLGFTLPADLSASDALLRPRRDHRAVHARTRRHHGRAHRRPASVSTIDLDYLDAITVDREVLTP